jgi:hypothetical protein
MIILLTGGEGQILQVFYSFFRGIKRLHVPVFFETILNLSDFDKYNVPCYISI